MKSYHWKKVLSLLLALVMCIGLLPMDVFAAEIGDESELPAVVENEGEKSVSDLDSAATEPKDDDSDETDEKKSDSQELPEGEQPGETEKAEEVDEEAAADKTKEVKTEEVKTEEVKTEETEKVAEEEPLPEPEQSYTEEKGNKGTFSASSVGRYASVRPGR